MLSLACLHWRTCLHDRVDKPWNRICSRNQNLRNYIFPSHGNGIGTRPSPSRFFRLYSFKFFLPLGPILVDRRGSVKVRKYWLFIFLIREPEITGSFPLSPSWRMTSSFQRGATWYGVISRFGADIIEQELSYRKHMGRQLRTQYVEGIHRPNYYTVTLKSRLRVTQSHRKRDH